MNLIFGTLIAQNKNVEKSPDRKQYDKPLPKTGKDIVLMRNKSAQTSSFKSNKKNKGRKVKKKDPKQIIEIQNYTGETQPSPPAMNIPKVDLKSTTVIQRGRKMNNPALANSTGDFKVRKKDPRSILEIQEYRGETDQQAPNMKMPLLDQKSTSFVQKGKKRNDPALANSKGDFKVKKKDPRSVFEIRDYVGETEAFVPIMSMPKIGIEGLSVVDNSKQKKEEKSKKQREYTGDQKYIDFKQVRKDRNRVLSSSIGDNERIDISVLDNIKEKRAEKSKKQREYAGDMNNYLQNRSEYIKNKSKKLSSYSGDILVSTLKKREQRARSKSKDMADYHGDIIVAKRTKGMHPSAGYTSRNVMGTYAAKAKNRKKILDKMRKTRDREEPEFFKKKPGKPKYDENEYKIWQFERK